MTVYSTADRKWLLTWHDSLIWKGIAFVIFLYEYHQNGSKVI